MKYTAIMLKPFDSTVNGLMYTKEAVVKAFEGLETKEFFGEISTNGSTTVDLEKVSHKVDNIHLEEDGIHGDVTIMTTPMGEALRDLLERGVVEPLFRPRYTGRIDKDTKEVSDLRIISFDFIQDYAGDK